MIISGRDKKYPFTTFSFFCLPNVWLVHVYVSLTFFVNIVKCTKDRSLRDCKMPVLNKYALIFSIIFHTETIATLSKFAIQPLFWLFYRKHTFSGNFVQLLALSLFISFSIIQTYSPSAQRVICIVYVHEFFLCFLV